MKYLFLLTVISQAAFASPDYCVAIRGNGQNVAAHWAGLARMVEDNGMPKKLAGGSSATVTMFLMDSMNGNPLIAREKDEEKKKEIQALLIKSMPEFTATMANHDQISSAWELMAKLKDKDSDLSKKAAAFFSGDINVDEFKKAFQKYAPIINPELLKGLAKKPNFYRNEAKDAATVFGHFDAVGDKNMFFRPGIVDFKAFSLILGQMADFYAGNTDEETKASLAQYTKDCAKKSLHVDWQKTPSDCQAKFKEIVNQYLSKGNFQNKALFEKVGKNTSSIPSTAVISGHGVERFMDLKASYVDGDKNRDYSNFSVRFSENNDSELSFGYWGGKPELEKIQTDLKKNHGNLKSEKFRAIPGGNPNWFEVLATSPAEPGLASIQPFPQNTTREKVIGELKKPAMERWSGLSYRKDILSAGGWSDLHPVEALKASGCDHVAYLTRKDGEAVFGQQVFIRLTGGKDRIPFWNKIGENNNKGWDVKGTKAEGTPWDKLYNYHSGSAFNQAIDAADIVCCTDWNRYEPFDGQMWGMTAQAYGEDSPCFVKEGVSFQAPKAKQKPTPDNYPGCIAKRSGRGPALGRPGDISIDPAK